jgi:hypothetical protein
MTAAAAVVILPPLSEMPLDPARTLDAQLLPVLAERSNGHDVRGAEEWWVLRDCLQRRPDEDAVGGVEPAGWVVLQQALGIAIATAENAPAGAEEQVRNRLRQSGFAEMFTGELPIVSVRLDAAADPAISLLDRIRAAFVDPPVALSVDDPDWPEWVVDVLAPPARSAEEPAASEPSAPDAARHRPPVGASRSALPPQLIWAFGTVSLLALLAGVLAHGGAASRSETARGPQAVYVALAAPPVPADGEPPIAALGPPTSVPSARTAAAPAAVTASRPAERHASRKARRASASAATRRAKGEARRQDPVLKAAVSVSSTVRAWGRGIAGWWHRLSSPPRQASRRQADGR